MVRMRSISSPLVESRTARTRHHDMKHLALCEEFAPHAKLLLCAF
jgi:hypothetical protein